MQCHGCKYPESHVVYTRYNEKENKITRQRECLRCGLRFMTNEKLREPKKSEQKTK